MAKGWILLLLTFLWVPFCFGKEAPPRYLVSCENLAACPEYVMGISADRHTVCSGVLVKNDVIATNLHCIPEDLRHDGAACSDRLFFHFPKTRTSEEVTTGCERILTVSSPLGNTPLTPDYAFVKISEKVSRTTAVISTQGIDDNESLNIFKVDPEKGGIGIVRKITCKAAQSSLLNPLFLNKQSAVVGLVPCSIVQGNSGSPMLSESSELKGLVSAKGNPSDTSIKSDRTFDMAYGSNFYCLNVPELGLSNSTKECHESITEETVGKASTELVRHAFDPFIGPFNKKITDELISIHKQSKFIVQWDATQKDEVFSGNEKLQVMKAFFKPKCILVNPEVLKKKYKALKDTEITYKLNYSIWGLELHLDSQGRPVPQLVAKETASTLSFTPKDLLKEPVRLIFDKTPLSVPFCPLKD